MTIIRQHTGQERKPVTGVYEGLCAPQSHCKFCFISIKYFYQCAIILLCHNIIIPLTHDTIRYIAIQPLVWRSSCKPPHRTQSACHVWLSLQYLSLSISVNMIVKHLMHWYSIVCPYQPLLPGNIYLFIDYRNFIFVNAIPIFMMMNKEQTTLYKK